MASIDRMTKDFLAQHRIAVAGVSRAKEGAAVSVYRRLKSTGHEVFAVNPHAEELEGDPCYPDLKSIPGGVDGVVVVTRPEVTETIVRECAQAGVRRVWMHRSFMGSSVSRRAVAFCRDHDIEVIAGACPMMFCEPVDFGHKCMRWWLRLSSGMPK